MKSFVSRSLILVLAICTFGASSAFAALESSYTFNGRGNWSIDGVGSNSTPVGTINVEVPSGSTVEHAFLYSTTSGKIPAPTVNLDGTVYSGADWTALGITSVELQAYRVDVTAQIAAKVGSGGGTFEFVVESESSTRNVDGEVLAVVYSNPTEKIRTIGFLDGFSATTGDDVTINFAEPLEDVGTADFEAFFSVGIGFSFQPGSQVSHINIFGNGERLTSSAGGQDDGIGSDGGLITVGGLGDSTDNPVDPNAPATDTRTDDELYNLEPFLSNGDTSFRVETINPSNDDNIFLMAINITAIAGVDQPPPDVDPKELIPVPTLNQWGLILLTLGMAAFGYAILRRRRFN